ncbi:S-adenosylmethionine:tRNA ribosyltransferase-isomerase, partial [bacterium]|nr:S-adenosylmethionine:tRNA ribosyltransferase-isomerase [bacterium]
MLVLNNTKVLPARLYGTKDTGAKIEVFLLEQKQDKQWSCLIKPSKRVKPDTIVTISDELKVKPIKRLEDDGEWLVEMIYDGDLFEILHKVG